VISRELKKTGREYCPSLAEMKPRLIEHHVMTGRLNANPHAKLSPTTGKVFQA
jgi:hypothetical protein